MKIQTIVTSLFFITASALSIFSCAISFGDGDKSAAPALLAGSFGIIAAGLILAVLFGRRNNRQRPDLGQ